MAVGVPIAAAVIGAGATIYESNQASKAAEKAARRPAPIEPPKAPDVANTKTELERANMLAQTAGGSLLSDPVENQRTGRQIGSAVKPGASLLGS